jgi:hypothetical protein
VTNRFKDDRQAETLDMMIANIGKLFLTKGREKVMGEKWN